MKTKYVSFTLLMTVLFASACTDAAKTIPAACTEFLAGQQEQRPKTTLCLEDKIRLVQELKKAKSAHNIEALLTLYDPDLVLEQPSLGVRINGYDELKPQLVAFSKHFPDYERNVDGFAESADMLISWGQTKVTLTGDIAGMIPNGKKSSVMTFVIFKFKGDRIIYEGHYWDIASIARQSAVTVDAIRQSAGMEPSE